MTLSRAQVLIHRGYMFFKSFANNILVFNCSQAQFFFFLTHTAHEINCAYEPAAGPQARKVTLFTGREDSFYLISCLLLLTTTKKFDFVIFLFLFY